VAGSLGVTMRWVPFRRVEPPRPGGPRRRILVAWSDFAVLFGVYLLGLLGAGLALGGDEARDVAVGNAVGALLAVSVVLVLIYRRWRRS
jgi:hypothetical protein